MEIHTVIKTYANYRQACSTMEYIEEFNRLSTIAQRMKKAARRKTEQ